MAYMTGWVAAYFYRRWLLTRDRHFLEKIAYPALKKFAVFYSGFLEKGRDGKYHAFPSNQGEADFSLENAYDRPQVMFHAAFALRCAAESARELGCDLPLAEKWQMEYSGFPEQFKRMCGGIAPEFFSFDGQCYNLSDIPDFFILGNRFHDWYFGQLPYKLSIRLRCGTWTEDFHSRLLSVLKRWLQPNGLLRAMSVATHGFRGAWSESLGIAGALTDMLMTSDGGIITLFPGIPADLSAEFTSLRAEGAFLVSSQKSHNVEFVDIFSEKGGKCRIKNPWGKSRCILMDSEEISCFSGQIIEFETKSGKNYQLRRSPDEPIFKVDISHAGGCLSSIMDTTIK